MAEFLLKMSGRTALGLLVGFAAMVWIGPQTTGGKILLIVTCVAIVLVVVSIVQFSIGIFSRKAPLPTVNPEQPVAPAPPVQAPQGGDRAGTSPPPPPARPPITPEIEAKSGEGNSGKASSAGDTPPEKPR